MVSLVTIVAERKIYISGLISEELGSSDTLTNGKGCMVFFSVKGSNFPEYKLFMIQLKGCMISEHDKKNPHLTEIYIKYIK